jgi:hydrogenase-4 component H
MRKPAFLQPRVLRLAIISALSPAYTTKFPAVPFEPAPEFRGRPRYDADQCIGCGACAQVCPSKCIEVVDDLAADPPRRTLVQHFDACIMCGQCARYCPTGAGIRMSTDWDTAGFRPEDFEERVEKELVLCEVCGEVLAPAAQLDWLAGRLGPVAFANPALTLHAGLALGCTEAGVKNPAEEFLRQDRMAMTCPKCRRQAAWAA